MVVNKIGKENEMPQCHYSCKQKDSITVLNEKYTKDKIECIKCFWTGTYADLIAPTSADEPSCPDCLNDDFIEPEDYYAD